tara:strand:- start:2179 stop:2643 length:465 start_codon:yes stop_codon:yes gene_type:complete
MSTLKVNALQNTSGNTLNFIKQVVYAETNTETTVTSNVLIDTTLQATITPTSSSSKILVIIDHPNCAKSTNTASGIRLYLYRGSTEIRQITNGAGKNNQTDTFIFGISSHYYDSPATTSSITYKTKFNNFVSGSSVTVQDNNIHSYMTLVEVAQ